jgi:hypothetical protein
VASTRQMLRPYGGLPYTGHNLSLSPSVFLSSPLMGEDIGEGERGATSILGPLSLALSHGGRGNWGRRARKNQRLEA